jgi:hypothetical protein
MAVWSNERTELCSKGSGLANLRKGFESTTWSTNNKQENEVKVKPLVQEAFNLISER